MSVRQMALLPQPAGPSKNTLHRTTKISRSWLTFRQNLSSGWYPSSMAASFTCRHHRSSNAGWIHNKVKHALRMICLCCSLSDQQNVSILLHERCS